MGNRVLISSLPASMSERKLKQLMQSVGEVEVNFCYYLMAIASLFFAQNTRNPQYTEHDCSNSHRYWRMVIKYIMQFSEVFYINTTVLMLFWSGTYSYIVLIFDQFRKSRDFHLLVASLEFRSNHRFGSAEVPWTPFPRNRFVGAQNVFRD